MSEQVIPFVISDGAWYVRPAQGNACFEICKSDIEVIAMADENGDAALMACAKDALDTLIRIQRICSVEAPDGSPLTKSVLTTSEIELIMDGINAVFGKIANEVST